MLLHELPSQQKIVPLYDLPSQITKQLLITGKLLSKNKSHHYHSGALRWTAFTGPVFWFKVLYLYCNP
jgi:hypothetical protein